MWYEHPQTTQNVTKWKHKWRAYWELPIGMLATWHTECWSWPITVKSMDNIATCIYIMTEWSHNHSQSLRSKQNIGQVHPEPTRFGYISAIFKCFPVASLLTEHTVRCPWLFQSFVLTGVDGYTHVIILMQHLKAVALSLQGQLRVQRGFSNHRALWLSWCLNVIVFMSSRAAVSEGETPGCCVHTGPVQTHLAQESFLRPVGNRPRRPALLPDRDDLHGHHPGQRADRPVMVMVRARTVAMTTRAVTVTTRPETVKTRGAETGNDLFVNCVFVCVMNSSPSSSWMVAR